MIDDAEDAPFQTMRALIKQAPPELGGAILEQQIKGYAKYGKSVDQAALKLNEWVDHAVSELIDACVYLRRIKVTQAEDIAREKAKAKKWSDLAERASVLISTSPIQTDSTRRFISDFADVVYSKRSAAP